MLDQPGRDLKIWHFGPVKVVSSDGASINLHLAAYQFEMHPPADSLAIDPSGFEPNRRSRSASSPWPCCVSSPASRLGFPCPTVASAHRIRMASSRSPRSASRSARRSVVYRSSASARARSSSRSPRSASSLANCEAVLGERLVREGAIVPGHDGRAMRFDRDQVFASPSAAAAVVVGRTANGRDDWKLQGPGASFGEWHAQGIEQAAGEVSP
jgi:hypothetical protein